MQIRPVYFILPGTEVLAKFENKDGELRYFKGTVKKIHRYGYDEEKGGYVSCHIKYDDGQDVEESMFYNQDFENVNSEESWRFTSQISLLVKYLVQTNEDIERMKDDIADEDEREEEEDEYEEERSAPPSPSFFSIFVWDLIKLSVPLSVLYYMRDTVCQCV